MKRIMLFLVLFLAVYQTAQANGIFFDHEDIHYNCVHDDNCVHLEKTEKESE